MAAAVAAATVDASGTTPPPLCGPTLPSSTLLSPLSPSPSPSEPGGNAAPLYNAPTSTEISIQVTPIGPTVPLVSAAWGGT